MAAVKLTASIVEKFIPPRAQNSRKGDNGKILILGGSYVYHGAPILASLAALRCGTDLVYTAVPKINSQATRAASPNLIVIPLADQKLTRGAAKKLLGQTPVGLDSAAIGMGLAVQERNSLLMLIKTLLDSDVRLLLDASALVPEVLPEISGKNCILSPHTGEYKRLFGHAVPDDDASREREVEKMAAEHKVVIILKGAALGIRSISEGIPERFSKSDTSFAHFSIPSPVAETLGCATSFCRFKIIDGVFFSMYFSEFMHYHLYDQSFSSHMGYYHIHQ